MLKELMISLGYDKNKIDKMRNTYPVNKCGDEYLCAAIPEIFNLFIKLGYKKKQIINMTTERPHIFCCGVDVILDKFEHLVELFGNKEVVIKVTVNFPTLYSYDKETIDSKIDELIKLGYKKEVIIKNLKNYPGMLGLSIEDNVKEMIKEFKKFGFGDADILKITSKNMSIFGRDKKIIKDVVEKLEGYGYTRKEVISMIRKHPQIFNYASDRIDNRINDLVDLGIDYDDAIKILKLNPAILGDSKVTLENKKIFYDSIGLFNIFVSDPEDLFQGIAKSYARLMHFQSIGVNIYETEDSYKELFIGETRFKSKYKVKSEDLIKIYDVKEYMRKVKTKKLA